MKSSFFFFFNDTATTEIYTLSLHDALPISEGCPLGNARRHPVPGPSAPGVPGARRVHARTGRSAAARDEPATQRFGLSGRSEEHTSELQSRSDLVCRLLLEKKKKPRPVEAS